MRKKPDQDAYDLLVIGGGINGTAIARHAAGDGMSVLLCERDDLASHTSSASTKLIHGGFRYLEYYDFKLVREALIEREVLLRAAPHIIWPMRFVLPYGKARLGKGMRPAWLLRLGLFLYDHMGGRKLLPATKTLKPSSPLIAGVLQDGFDTGFEYSDCWVEDARLVVLNAVDAAAKGADIMTRTMVRALTASGDGYEAQVQTHDGVTHAVTARAVVNAAGPWVEDMLQRLSSRDRADAPARNDSGLRLVKGSHIVVPRLYEHNRAYLFQNADSRIIFAIPYEQDYTLIGTTDRPYEFNEGPPEISAEEADYLCNAASEYFLSPVTPDDIVWSYAGVRPLYDDRSDNASAVTRDYVLDILKSDGGAPILSVFGGKITTSRHLARHVMQKLSPHMMRRAASNWTRNATLPGGDIPALDTEAYLSSLQDTWPELSPKLLKRLMRAYGTRVRAILTDTDHTLLTPRLPQSLLACEVDYLVDTEFALHPDDVLWRRSKLGLHMSASEREDFGTWFASRRKDMAAKATATGSTGGTPANAA